MHSGLRSIVASVAAGAVMLLAGPAHAACSVSSQYRAMHGRIVVVDGTQLTLEQRGGDRVAFGKAGGVQVMGARSGWGALAVGDRAIVGWKMADSPALAHEVCVLPAD